MVISPCVDRENDLFIYNTSLLNFENTPGIVFLRTAEVFRHIPTILPLQRVLNHYSCCILALCFLKGRSDPHLTHWEGATFKQPWIHPKYAAFHVGIGLSYRISPWYQCYTPSFPREGMQLVLEAKFAVCEVPSYLPGGRRAPLGFCLLREICWLNLIKQKLFQKKSPCGTRL